MPDSKIKTKQQSDLLKHSIIVYPQGNNMEIKVSDIINFR